MEAQSERMGERERERREGEEGEGRREEETKVRKRTVNSQRKVERNS